MNESSIAGFTLDDYFNQKSDYSASSMKETSKELAKVGAGNILGGLNDNGDAPLACFPTEDNEDNEEDRYEADYESDHSSPLVSAVAGMSLGDYFQSKVEYSEDKMKEKSALLNADEKEREQKRHDKKQAFKNKHHTSNGTSNSTSNYKNTTTTIADKKQGMSSDTRKIVSMPTTYSSTTLTVGNTHSNSSRKAREKHKTYSKRKKVSPVVYGTRHDVNKSLFTSTLLQSNDMRKTIQPNTPTRKGPYGGYAGAYKSKRKSGRRRKKGVLLPSKRLTPAYAVIDLCKLPPL